VPTLITNGTHDAITPAVWAERAAIYLDKVWLRLFPGYGHAILSTGDACAQEMIGLFYANPNADPSPPCFHDLRLDFLVP
jgi:pimeloyl-ACP methyl ester carboxylesterase